MALLEVKDLHAKVDGKEILRGVDLEIGKGEVHVLLGPNASGKTSLALTLIGMPAYEVSKGKILFDGENIVDLNAAQRAKKGWGSHSSFRLQLGE